MISNLVISPGGADALGQRELTELSRLAQKEPVAGSVPFLYRVVELSGLGIVLAGTDLGQVRQVYPFWEVTGEWPGGPRQALLGVEAAEKTRLGPGDRVELNDVEKGFQTTLTIAGLVASGDETDNQLIVDIGLAREISGREGADVVYWSVLGRGDEITRVAQDVSALAGVRAEPITRISTAEGSIMDKIIGLVALAVAVTLLIGLCVGTTMLASVVERRREIGLKKALGASGTEVMREFLAEALVIGAFGGLLGWLLGWPRPSVTVSSGHPYP